MNTSKRTPPPDAVAPRRTAESVAKVVKEVLPVEGHSLGPISEETLTNLLDEADEDEARHRRIMKFPPAWREFIRRQDTIRLAAIDELVNDHLERKALRKFWVRIYRISILVVPIVFGWASGFFEKVWPLIQKILKLLQAPPA